MRKRILTLTMALFVLVAMSVSAQDKKQEPKKDTKVEAKKDTTKVKAGVTKAPEKKPEAKKDTTKVAPKKK